MHMKKLGVVAGAALMALSMGAQAGVKAGDLEIGVSGDLTSTEGSDSLNLSGSVGYFFTDNWQGKLAASLDVSDSAAGDSESVFIYTGADYNWAIADNKDLVPFAGGGVAFLTGDASAEFFDIHVGIKNFLSERTSLQTQLLFLSPFESGGDGVTQLQVGLNFYF